MTRLEVEGLTVRFGGVTALDGVSLAVGPGEIVGLVGSNGAGKTTVLDAISGVVRPSGGRVRLAGDDPAGDDPAGHDPAGHDPAGHDPAGHDPAGHDLTLLRPRAIARLGVARTFQNLGLAADLSVDANLLLGRHARMRTGPLRAAFRPGLARAEDARHRAVCHQVATRLGLAGHLQARVGSLPFGVRRLVEVARALASEPVVLLADEPTAGLDPGEASTVVGLLGEWRREWGSSVLLVDHDSELVLGVADRVVVLDAGVVLATGKPAELAADPRLARHLGRAATTP